MKKPLPRAMPEGFQRDDQGDFWVRWWGRSKGFGLIVIIKGGDTGARGTRPWQELS